MPIAPDLIYGMDASPVVKEGVLRLAGDVELPENLDVIRRILLEGRLVDDHGTIHITPGGGVSFMHKDGYGVEGNFGHDPNIQFKFDRRF